MRHVLILDDDPDARQRLRRSLRGAPVSLYQAGSLLAAYRRIAALPTLDVLIVNVAHSERRAVEDFARRVIPAITVIPVGARGGATIGLNSPCVPCAPWSVVVEDLTRALTPGETPDLGPGQATAGRWAG